MDHWITACGRWALVDQIQHSLDHTHAVGFGPQHRFQLMGGYDLEVVGEVEARRAVEMAENRWLKASVEAQLAAAHGHLESNPTRAMQSLRDFGDAFAVVNAPQEAKEDLQQARQQAVEAVLKELRSLALDLIRAESYEGVSELLDGMAPQLKDEARIVGLSKPLADFRHSCEFLITLHRIPTAD